MNKIFVTSLLLVSQFFLSQATRNVGEFSSLKVYDKISVELVQSDEDKVEISGADESDVQTVNNSGELKIRMTPAYVMQGDQVKVTVYYDNLTDIQASQGSKISSSEPLKNNKLILVSNEGSNINIAVENNAIDAKLNSGGIITISGTVTRQDVIVNSGAIYNARELQSEKTSITTNAGGFAEVNVSKSVNATTRVGGVIDIYGDPVTRNTKGLIGGKINFK